MAERKISIINCDGCGKSTLVNDIDFLEPVFVRFGQKVLPDETATRLDLCMECDEAGCFRCYQCKTVHKHESECKFLAEENQREELSYKLPY